MVLLFFALKLRPASLNRNENKEELIDAVITEDEKKRVDEGDDFCLYLQVTDIEDTVSDAERSLAMQALEAWKKEAEAGCILH